MNDRFQSMPLYTFKFRHYSVVREIPPARINFEQLNRVWRDFQALCDQATEHETKHIEEVAFPVVEARDPEDSSKDANFAIRTQNIFKLKSSSPTINVKDSMGQLFSFTPEPGERNVFDSIEMPRRIVSVKMDNFEFFEYQNRDRLKNYKVSIFLDFSDYKISPFAPEDVNYKSRSFISVTGLQDTWVYGAAEKLEQALAEEASLVANSLHRYLSYNLFSWLVSVPLALLVLYKVSERWPASSGADLSVRTLFFLVLGLLIMLLVRTVYLYTKYLFPYLELKDQPKQLQALQRWLGGGLIGIIISSLVALVIQKFFL